jgi:hypothetical protein
MQELIRRAIAHVAVVRSGERPNSYVFSHDSGALTAFSHAGTSSYDHAAGANITGTGPNLFHHGVGRVIEFTINGNFFGGYDYDSGSHFRGTVHGHAVEIYDYGEKQSFSYVA